MAAVAAAGLGLGLFEAQWVERRIVQVAVPRLPAGLDGLRILHLSDLHLGSVSLNGLALGRAVEWACGERLDLVALTGDLLARPQGQPALRRALARLSPSLGTVAILGNVDVADTRDPFSTGGGVDRLDPHAVLLSDDAVTFEAGGCRIQVVGASPSARHAPPSHLCDSAADLRILLAHFPDSADRLEPGAFDLVLSGHTHDGQVCVPYPGGKVRLAGPREPYPAGTFHLEGSTLVVSRGVGTTFVPVRFFARPEASILELRPLQG